MTLQARRFAKAMKAPLIFCSASHAINIHKIFKVVLAKVFDLKCTVQQITDIGDPIIEYEQSATATDDGGADGGAAAPAAGSSQVGASEEGDAAGGEDATGDGAASSGAAHRRNTSSVSSVNSSNGSATKGHHSTHSIGSNAD